MEVLYKKTLHAVNLAVRLIDDFTGKPLSGSGYRFYVNDVEVHPIRKADGYFVITGLQCDAYCLKITSPWYCTNELYIGTVGHEKLNSPLDVRLYPGCAYPMLSGVTVYSGIYASDHLKKTDGISVTLIVALAGGRIKLKSIGKKEVLSKVSVITLQNPDGKDLSGMTIVLGSDKMDFPVETTVLERHLEGNTYETSTCLQQQYSSGATVYRVYRALTDSRGKVLIPVESSTQTELEVLMEAASGETRVSGKRLLATGTTTTYHEVI